MTVILFSSFLVAQTVQPTRERPTMALTCENHATEINYLSSCYVTMNYRMPRPAIIKVILKMTEVAGRLGNFYTVASELSVIEDM